MTSRLSAEDRKRPEWRHYVRNFVIFVALIPVMIFVADLVYGAFG
jgi:hypothetical protein